MSTPKVSVIGAGGWGTALALLMAKRGQEVTIWGHDPFMWKQCVLRVRTESTFQASPYLL